MRIQWFLSTSSGSSPSQSVISDRGLGITHCKWHKGKVHPRTGHEGPDWEQRYSPTLYLTSALDGVGSQCHAPAILPPRIIRYQLYRRLGGLQGQSGRVWKISPPSSSRSPDHPTASCYTNDATPAHLYGKIPQYMLAQVTLFWYITILY